jgi:hypothetical protein
MAPEIPGYYGEHPDDDQFEQLDEDERLAELYGGGEPDEEDKWP